MPGSLGGCVSIISGKSNDSEIGGRLGKRDLGRHAFEYTMPKWLHRLLEDEEKLHLVDAPYAISEILGIILAQDSDVEVAYLCHPNVRYVGKVKGRCRNEGNNFCGYRNIQMLLSYVTTISGDSPESDAGVIPTIREVQNLIEEAWDQGFNESGRVQTGGIKGTRKHIGTPEAQALLRSLKISCKGDRFQDVKGGAKAYEKLLDSVEQYFSTLNTTSHRRISRTIEMTRLPPIYLQRPRHSMTIVGLEMRKDGSRSLLVYDPAYNPSKEMLKRLDRPSAINGIDLPRSLIEPYRRGKNYLKRYHTFETLRLDVAS